MNPRIYKGSRGIYLLYIYSIYPELGDADLLTRLGDDQLLIWFVLPT